jgi:hypothetical protein
MPITINDADNVATTDEADSVLGRAIDGMLGAVTGENLTSAEAFWCAAGYGTLGVGVGSVMTRKKLIANPAAKPVLGVFL